MRFRAILLHRTTRIVRANAVARLAKSCFLVNSDLENPVKTMSITPARLCFETDGTPRSILYGDVYHTRSGGPDQARHVFLAGNDLPQRWQGKERFSILETGFGLGLNFLTTWANWKAGSAPCQQLHFFSVEKHPLTTSDLLTAQAQWPEFAELAAQLRKLWPPLEPGRHQIALEEGRILLELVWGDANEALAELDNRFDAFYLDGFSPDKNPDLWSVSLFRQLARLSACHASFATWSVAGIVRRGLSEVGFQVEKRPGFAGKRHMLVGRLHNEGSL